MPHAEHPGTCDQTDYSQPGAEGPAAHAFGLQPAWFTGGCGCGAEVSGDDHAAALEAEVQALRDEVARSRLVLASATEYAIITLDAAGCITGWNTGAARTLGYAEDEVLGRSGELVFTFEDRMAGRFEAELRRASERGCATNERWHVRRDGTRFWASGMMMPLLDADGAQKGLLNILRDRTEAQAAAERRELLMEEMNHRIKNTFATVQAVAAQTGGHATAPQDCRPAFNARLTALARSHDVLIRRRWEDAPLQDVIEAALAAYRGDAGRVTIEGPPALLPASQVVTASLAFHELGTNAAKYGSLSVPGGRVEVSWAVVPTGSGRRAEVTWRERGGPPVRPPERRGFGSQLLERGIAPGGAVQLVYAPDGLECRMALPLAAEPQDRADA